MIHPLNSNTSGILLKTINNPSSTTKKIATHRQSNPQRSNSRCSIRDRRKRRLDERGRHNPLIADGEYAHPIQLGRRRVLAASRLQASQLGGIPVVNADPLGGPVEQQSFGLEDVEGGGNLFLLCVLERCWSGA